MRELVRGLPRAKAPWMWEIRCGKRWSGRCCWRIRRRQAAGAAGGSLAAVLRHRGDFSAGCSLCFILYKALGPTWKPAVFTQSVADGVPGNGLLGQERGESGGGAGGERRVHASGKRSPRPRRRRVAAAPAAIRAGGRSSTPASNALLQKAQQLVVQSQQQMMSVAQLDVQAIRRRLESSGYGIQGGRRNRGVSGVRGRGGGVIRRRFLWSWTAPILRRPKPR